MWVFVFRKDTDDGVTEEENRAYAWVVVWVDSWREIYSPLFSTDREQHIVLNSTSYFVVNSS